MKKLKILCVVGARPNFPKIAPIMREFTKYPKEFEIILVHTGQHYSHSLSGSHFKDLEIPTPKYNLKIGQCTPIEQLTKIMSGLEKILLGEKPNWVLVLGDVNSTLAATIAANKCNIKIAHIESGLRASSPTFSPEETNRRLVDHVSDILFTSCELASKNLIKENIPKNKIILVGNIMIDSLLWLKTKVRKEESKTPYIVATIHHQDILKNKKKLNEVLNTFGEISKKLQVIFIIHPGTKNKIKEYKIKIPKNITVLDPLPSTEFINLWENSSLIVTDSSGLAEEAYFLNKKTLVICGENERSGFLESNTVKYIDPVKETILKETSKVLNSKEIKKNKPLKYWDGKTAERVVNFFRKLN